MSIIGIQTDRENPAFTKADFLFWKPQYKNVADIDTLFAKLYPVANQKCFKSIFGEDWEYAMSLCISHYLILRQRGLLTPAGDSLETVPGTTVYHGVVSSASVGSFSKSIESSKTISEDREALFWNSTPDGAAYWALLCSKPIASIMVVTTHNIPGAGN